MMLRHLWIFVVAFAVAGGTFSAALLFPKALATFSPDEEKKAAPSAGTESVDRTKTTKATTSRNAGTNILIRRTLLTLNDANLSGNYSILRQLAAPGLQRAHSSAALSRAFADLRNRKVDMAALVNFAPELTRKPKLDKNGRLRLTGFVPTRPQQINFDLLFEKHRKRWRLFAISVKVLAPKTAAVAR